MTNKKDRNKMKSQSKKPSDMGNSDEKETVISSGGEEEQESVSTGGWSDVRQPSYRKFPGPRLVDVVLRVTFEKSAYAELLAHAKETLDAEVCGVLAGQVFEDDEGMYIHVKATVRGAAARQGSSHVTYTQETWNIIHETMETKYPKLQIVGWYHSHPGYGAEFSDMDTFIQKNFFSAPSQVGLLMDPIGGDTGLCVNTSDGICNIDRFWVEGREQRCYMPISKKTKSESGYSTEGPVAGIVDDQLESLEKKLQQVTLALDDLRNTIYRFLMTAGVIVGVAIVFGIIYFIYSSSMVRVNPPEVRSFAPVPVQVGDKVCYLGVGIISWEIPPEMVPSLPSNIKKEETGAEPNNQGQPSPHTDQQPSTGAPAQTGNTDLKPAPASDKNPAK